MRKTDTWFITHSGRDFDFADLSVGMIHWPDVATALAKVCRFGGHCKGFYSVAQHSVLVADILAMETDDPVIRLHGLLHDAHEAYTGDLIRPMKQLIGQDVVKQIEHSVDRVIYEKAGIDPPDDELRATIKRADLIALATETQSLVDMTTDNKPWICLQGVEPLDRKVFTLEWEAAAYRWKDDFDFTLGRIRK